MSEEFKYAQVIVSFPEQEDQLLHVIARMADDNGTIIEGITLNLESMFGVRPKVSMIKSVPASDYFDGPVVFFNTHETDIEEDAIRAMIEQGRQLERANIATRLREAYSLARNASNANTEAGKARVETLAATIRAVETSAFSNSMFTAMTMDMKQAGYTDDSGNPLPVNLWKHLDKVM